MSTPEAGGRLRSLLLAVPAAVRRDYAATMATQWCTLAIGLLLFHLVARRGGVGGFAFYQVARGSVAALQPLVLAGLGTGLPRYLPRAGAAAPGLVRRALGLQLTILAAVASVALALSRTVAGLLGLAGGAAAVAAITVLLAGSCLCATALAGLRGTGQVAYANLGSLTGFAALPVIAFTVTDGIDAFLVVYGAGMAAVAAAVTVVTRPPATAAADPPALSVVLRYGLRRILGDLSLPALLAFPTFAVAVARPGAPEAGYVGFVTSAITLVCAFFGMLTPVLLPRLSAHFHHGTGEPSLHRVLVLLPLVAAGLAAVLALIIALPAPVLIRHFLGAEFSPAVRLLRIGMLAAVPLAMFYAVRPTLDALHETPMTAGPVVGCLVLQVLVTYALSRALDVPLAAVLALAVAAAALGLACWLRLRREMAKRAL
jgi:O-antigen/teichoic acid export membrane protein